MPTTSQQASERPRIVAREVALGFGAVSIVSLAMCVALLGRISDIGDLVADMRQEEIATREGLALTTAVREQSMHIAHSLIEGDSSHVDHYEVWRQRITAHAKLLKPAVPEAERWRLQAVVDTSSRMHEKFMRVALPAARRGDFAKARRTHRVLDGLGRDAAEHADILSRSTESRMSHAHAGATDSTRLGMMAGGVCMLLVLALSLGFTLRLRAAVFKPLVVLTAAAGRFGRGEFDTRVGDVGRGELAALGRAFDRMAEELAVRQTRLVRSERMAAIGQLAAGVAHELNNPIGIIRGYLETMTPDGDVDNLRKELAIVDEEAAQCQRIAEDLLSYARTGDLTADRIEVGPLLEEVARRFRESAATDGRRIVVEVTDAVVEADSSRIRQVVHNLLLNAVQATPQDGEVRMRAGPDGDHYVIEVEDDGAGVDPEDGDRVFEPFFSKRRGGTGLGLSVVLGIVQAHHGCIEVLNADSGGAMLRVRLPLRQPRPSTPAPGEPT